MDFPRTPSPEPEAPRLLLWYRLRAWNDAGDIQVDARLGRAAVWLIAAAFLALGGLFALLVVSVLFLDSLVRTDCGHMRAILNPTPALGRELSNEGLPNDFSLDTNQVTAITSRPSANQPHFVPAQQS